MLCVLFVEQEDLYFDNDQWKVNPTRKGLIGSNPHGVIEREFTVSIAGFDCTQTFQMTFQHGAPAQLQVRSDSHRSTC